MHFLLGSLKRVELKCIPYLMLFSLLLIGEGPFDLLPQSPKRPRLLNCSERDRERERERVTQHTAQ